MKPAIANVPKEILHAWNKCQEKKQITTPHDSMPAIWQVAA